MKENEREMPDIYAMRRANGDWFALEDSDKPRVPVFHSSHDALMARLRNFEMLLFSPIALDTGLLNEIVADRSQVGFCLVNNPFASLKRGSALQFSQLASLITNGAPAPTRVVGTSLVVNTVQ